MSDPRRPKRESPLEADIKDLRLGQARHGGGRERSQTRELKLEDTNANETPPIDVKLRAASHSPIKNGISTSAYDGAQDHEEVLGGGITLKQEPGQPPKLSRSTSHKVVAGPAKLYNGYPDRTKEAQETFSVLGQCIYSSKYIGSTEHDSMECDCSEEWDGELGINAACGDDSDCINRATKMECVGDCGCGSECQNQRFQQQQFADVTVFKTEKKGYGLRAETDLLANEFIFEYIGEVINEGQFRKRMIQYDEEGVEHFYFMSLNKGEFVDATRKGNLGRFCNHSCNPNCYVDKWVVGEKLRMGIFAERKIKAGEELVFNYNVDRYGANPQPCYCGEPNCTGFIGGKTQTERATKLPNTTIEALGIDDGDGWDTAVARKPRKKKTGEDDEEYVNNVQPKSLDESGVTKVMATLMQCKEKWIAVKLLSRIQQCDDERVRNRVVKMHGYQILNTALSQWKDDANVVLQIFDVLDKFPRLTRNKISDSKIEATVQGLKECGDERVELQAEHLLKEWSELQTAYRIPRKKREETTGTPDKRTSHFGRRDSREERKGRSVSPSSADNSRSTSMDAPRGPAAPSGPRSSHPQRGAGFYDRPRPPFHPRPRPFNALPSGWFMTSDQNNRTYYYDASGKTTWQRPTQPAALPPPPPKPVSESKKLEDIINGITSANTNKPKAVTLASNTPQASTTPPTKNGKSSKEKWRSLPEEKQKKIYENTLFPHISGIMSRYKGKLPKEDLKRFAKELGKKLVNSDFKNNRVTDPTKLSEKQEKAAKKYVKDFFEKAVIKDKERQQKKEAKKAEEPNGTKSPIDIETMTTNEPNLDIDDDDDDDEQDTTMAENGEAVETKIESATPLTPTGESSTAESLKRKREASTSGNGIQEEDEEVTLAKRIRSASLEPPPPPPATIDGPPPEADATPTHGDYDGTEFSIRTLTAPPPPPPTTDFDESGEPDDRLGPPEMVRSYSVEA